MVALAPASPEGLAVGVAALGMLLLGVWVLWKVARFLVRLALLLLLGAVAAAVVWWLSSR